MGALWDYMTGKLEADGAEADRRLDAINSKSSELYGPEWAEQMETNRGRSSRADTIDAEVSGAFIEGAKEGAANVQATVKKGINTTVGFVAGSIPLVGWVILLGVLIWYMGGWARLRGILNLR